MSELPRPVRLTLTALILGALAPLLDSTIVTVALHDLSQSLHAGPSTVQWITTSYILVMGAAVPVSGWAQARFGSRHVWIASLVVFLLGSVLCACAPGVGALIAARVLQGGGAGMIFPLLQTIAVQSAGTAVPAETMGKVIATVSLPMALGPILGPVIGGVILHWLDWRWIFLVNVPLVAVAVVLALLWVPADRSRAGTGADTGADQAAEGSGRLDLVGLVLLIPGVVGVLLGLSELADAGTVARATVVWPLVSGVVLTALFILWALRRGSAALVDLHLLGHRDLAASSVLLTVTGAVLYATMFLLPLFFQEVRGDSVLTAAFLMVPQGVGALVSRVAAVRGAARFGAAGTAVAAFLLTVVATVPLAFADADTPVWWLVVVLFLRGCGVGALMIPPMMVAYRGLGPADVPHATIITRTLQQIGSSFGIALAAVVMEWLSSHGAAAPGSPDAVLTGFHGAFWCVTVLGLLALPVAGLLPSTTTPTPSGEDR